MGRRSRKSPTIMSAPALSSRTFLAALRTEKSVSLVATPSVRAPSALPSAISTFPSPTTASSSGATPACSTRRFSAASFAQDSLCGSAPAMSSAKPANPSAVASARTSAWSVPLAR